LYDQYNDAYGAYRYRPSFYSSPGYTQRVYPNGVQYTPFPEIQRSSCPDNASIPMVYHALHRKLKYDKSTRFYLCSSRLKVFPDNRQPEMDRNTVARPNPESRQDTAVKIPAEMPETGSAELETVGTASERRLQQGQAETDVKAGTTQHSPSRKSKSASQNIRHRTADRSSRHKKRRLTSTPGSTSTEGKRCDRKKSAAKEDEPYPPSDASIDSSSEEEVVPPMHIMKPPKFDGQCSFETFMVQFSNCADYNKWTEAQKLAHLRNSLEKDVANILWDYGKETTGSWKGLTEILETRFGGKAMAEKYRLELRNRRRSADETLQSLHSDIRRLAAFAYNGVTPEVRDPVTCDHFLDALGDPDLAFKIRERQPADIDSALRVALQLEAWTEEITRHRKT